MKLPSGWIFKIKSNTKGTAVEVTKSDLILCCDCKYFELNHFDNMNGIPLITAHEICTRWGDGCKTDINGFCFLADPKGEE